jgi:hypothetical protein
LEECVIDAYLIDAVVIRYLTALDPWNTPTWTNVSVMGRIEWQDKLIRNAQGEQVVSAALVYLSGNIIEPKTADRIIIGGVEHAIMRVDKKTDFSLSHLEIWIQ